MNVVSIARVASALSQEFGVRVEIGGRNAVTTFAKGQKPVITIPAVDNDDPHYLTLVRGYIDHEAGHVRFTRRDLPYLDSITKNLTNIFEDVYVERMMGECFPGCKRNLRKLVEHIFGGNTIEVLDVAAVENFTKSAPRNASEKLVGGILHYVLYKVRSDAVSGIHQQRLPDFKAPIDKLCPGLVGLLTPVLDRVRQDGTNTENNIKLAKEAAQIIRDYFAQSRDDLEEGGHNESGNDSGNDSGSADNSIEGEQEGETGSDTQQDRRSSPTTSSESDETSRASAKDLGRDMLDLMQDELTAGTIQQDLDIAEHVSKEISGELAGKLLPMEMDLMLPDRFLNKLSDAGIAEALRTSAALDAQLQALLQTIVLNRSGIGRMGRLDTNRLHKLAVGSDKVFRKRTEKQALNTEVILLVDMSGSMQGSKADTTSKALYAVLRSLRRIQGVTSSAMGFCGRQVVDILQANQRLTNRLQLNPSGGTYCGEALTQAIRRFSNDPETRKIVLIMTDGETQNASYFHQSVEMARRIGVELVGIGIEDSSITNYLPEAECCVIKRVSDLTSHLFRILRGKLLEVA